MQQYSILIACDQEYYNNWGINLLKSINFHNPWITLRCHLVNPLDPELLDFVIYSDEQIDFINDEVRISYLQSVRFLKVAEIPINENVLILDTDTICTRSFTQDEFEDLFTEVRVMKHHREERWLAGFVSFGKNDLRYRYKELLNLTPINEWKYGWDQTVLSQLSKEYDFVSASKDWIISGKNKDNSAFLTLKGDQKNTDKYLMNYKEYLILEDHLGGHAGITHIDEGALNWAIQEFNCKSFLDIGCGPGGMVELAHNTNLKSVGIDGDYTLKRFNQDNFIIHDFTTGPVDIDDKFDLGWSVEFVEHVYEEYIPNYITAMQKCKYLVLTYAPPGWPGHHHVNCQPEEYWIETLEKYGFNYDKKLTKSLRKNSTMGTKKKNRFVKNRGLFFVNYE